MEEFSFPFPPYDIQLALMREIKTCIENEQVGIFESPTGTGKSLSVLCSTMSWLEEHEKTYEQDLKEKASTTTEEDAQETDWIAAYKKKLESQKDVDAARDKLEILDRIREKIKKAKDGLVEKNRKRRTVQEDVNEEEASTSMKENQEDELILPDYNSDEEYGQSLPEEPLETVKVYYASRTHSQLEQLVAELRKTRFTPRTATAASRGTLCVNPDVAKLKLPHLINEKCMELRKNTGSGVKKTKDNEGKTTKKSCKTSCEFYKSEPIEELSNAILAGKANRPNEVISMGKQSTACPYFATRSSIPLCQLVLLPYQVLLHAATRAAWGIQLKGNVVVLDEAHNILQTISSLYSAEINSKSLTVARSLIQEYIDTYRTRLTAKNMLYMRHMLTVVSKLLDMLTKENSQQTEAVFTIQAFILKLGVFDINLFKLVQHMEATDMCRKFHGFLLRSQKKTVTIVAETKKSGIASLMAKKQVEPVPPPVSAPIEEEKTVPSPLYSLKTFLEALNNRCEDGRVIIEKKDGVSKYRFLLLNPADRLSDLVQQSRSVILVGGTMEPADLLVNCLTRSGLRQPLRRFSCQHVIDDDQLLAIALGRTVDDKPICLTYQTRNQEEFLRPLSQTLLHLVSCVPNGCVAFFPSYDYMYFFLEKMKKFGVYDKLQEKKSMFVEPRTSCSDLWEKFATAALSTKGAMLCAVVGGKLSEGINFSDALGRAVFMIGLPYPNKNSVELAEKMKYMDGQMPEGGKKLYDSLCMHAVNQAVGRAIRHRNDYAAVFLLDIRFSTASVSNQLSSWIGSRLMCLNSCQQAIQKTKQFFVANSNRQKK